jgi:hypothetical protein
LNSSSYKYGYNITIWINMIQYATIHHDHANLKGTHTQRHPLYCCRGFWTSYSCRGSFEGAMIFPWRNHRFQVISMVKRWSKTILAQKYPGCHHQFSLLTTCFYLRITPVQTVVESCGI